MHENEFEKQMQEKMKELQFSPSDAVWENVDQEINKKEKRRRPLFWLFLFFGLMVLGGGYYFITNNKSNTIISDNRSSKPIDEKRESSEKNKNTPGTEGDNGTENIADNKHSNELAADKQKSEANKNHKAEIDKLPEFKAEDAANDNNKISSTSKAGKEKLASGKQMNVTRREKELTDHKIPEKNRNEIISDNHKIGNDVLQKDERTDTSDADSVKPATAINVEKKKDVVAIKPVKTDSLADKKIAKADAKQKKSSSWKTGFVLAPGISNVHQGLFKSTSVYNASSFTANSPTNNAGGYYYQSSDIKSNFSFAAGLTLNKMLSKLVMFSAGINYHYYSTKIFIGDIVDSSINILSPNSGALVPGGYYRNGNSNSYINHYHFIEIPVALDFQLNKSNRFPLIWEAGLSALYLVNTNALHFDPYNGVYYKDNGEFNKMQISAASAFSIGFPVGKNQLQVGPQLQYGLSGLLKKSTGNSEHLFSAGLKIAFILNKK